MRNAVIALSAALIASAGAAGAADLPDLSKTPGVTRALTKKKICSIKWGRDERHVSTALKRQAFAAYGYSGNDDAKCIPTPAGRHCEVDHLISRELGGADVLPNLWPQSYGRAPDAGPGAADDRHRLDRGLREVLRPALGARPTTPSGRARPPALRRRTGARRRTRSYRG
jgi:hypothetical protein